MKDIVIELLGLAGLVFASNGFWEWVRSRRLSPKDRLSMAVARDRLLHLAKSYIKNGKIPSDEYDNFIEMGEAYIDMGGNHITKKRYLQAKELPVVDDDE